MEMNEYQGRALTTALYPSEYVIVYPALKLAGEAGEVAEKVGKVLRDEGGAFTDDTVKELSKELGDVLWYIAALADDLGLTMEDVATANLDKLESRRVRGVIQGSGDNR